MINKMCKAQKGRFVSTNMPNFFLLFVLKYRIMRNKMTKSLEFCLPIMF